MATVVIHETGCGLIVVRALVEAIVVVVVMVVVGFLIFLGG